MITELETECSNTVQTNVQINIIKSVNYILQKKLNFKKAFD